jgi:hypothetical protein
VAKLFLIATKRPRHELKTIFISERLGPLGLPAIGFALGEAGGFSCRCGKQFLLSVGPS